MFKFRPLSILDEELLMKETQIAGVRVAAVSGDIFNKTED